MTVAVPEHPDEILMWIWIGCMSLVILWVGTMLAYIMIKEILTNKRWWED